MKTRNSWIQMGRATGLCVAAALAGLTATTGHAQDVSVEFVGRNQANLRIEGGFDGGVGRSPQVMVRGDSGQLVITGLSGTTVNGQDSIVVDYPAFDIIVDLGSGGRTRAALHMYYLYYTGDDLRVDVDGDVYMALAGGGAMSHSDVVVNAWYSSLSAVFAHRDLILGPGSHTLHDCFADDFEMNGGWFSDNLTLNNLTVAGVARIKTSGGSDEIRINGLESLQGDVPLLEVFMGSGNDALFLDDCQTLLEFFDGGGNTDTIYLGTGNSFLLNSSNTNSVEWFK